MEKVLKLIIFPLLHFIRRGLTVLKNHCLPQTPLPPHPSPYDYLDKETRINCYNHFKKYFENSIFLFEEQIREYSIKKSIKNDKNLEKYYLEFGVWRGTSINFFSQFVKNIYGFDSFEGLKEEWKGHVEMSGTFDLGGKIPKLNKNVIVVKGWAQDTLPDFLKKKNPEINFVHMDMDTYETSKFVLSNLKLYILKNCIILFDELYNYTGWEVGEYKALRKVFKENEYKFLAFSRKGPAVAIQIL